MAGKHTGGIQNNVFAQPGTAAASAAFRPEFPGDKPDRAYAEGRTLGIQTASLFPPNPHPSGSPAFLAFGNGGFNSNQETSNSAVQAHSWNNPETPNP
jgi:hypothetical protein